MIEPALPTFSIEEHGPAGNWVLYYGRGPMQHGLNLVTLSDFDRDGAKTRAAIVDALNLLLTLDLPRLAEIDAAAGPAPWHWDKGDGSMPMLMHAAREDESSGDSVLGCSVCRTCFERGAPCMSPNEADMAMVVRAREIVKQLAEFYKKSRLV